MSIAGWTEHASDDELGLGVELAQHTHKGDAATLTLIGKALTKVGLAGLAELRS